MQTTTPASHPLCFYRPDALPDAQPTASKHWNTWYSEHQRFHCLNEEQRRKRATVVPPQITNPNSNLSNLTDASYVTIFTYSKFIFYILDFTLFTNTPSNIYKLAVHMLLNYITCQNEWEDVMDRSRWRKQIGMIDKCEWVNVSSGTGSPGLSRTKSTEP